MHRLLTEGELEIQGRILPASNATFFCQVTLDDEVAGCVYKPVSGERPLWDFPNDTLANREVAAYALSEALGWEIVPPTVLRDGPVGPGMVQLWCERDESVDPVDVVRQGSLPPGYCHVLDALDGKERPVSLVHEDSEPLRRMAVFDVLANNADRKGGHVLAMPDGHRYGVDHGVCFNEEHKLRTVLWGWSEQPLLPEHRVAVEKVRADLSLRACFGSLLSPEEVTAFEHRCTHLLATGVMPSPSGTWPAIPWPAF